MLRHRLLSILILAPVVVALTWLGGWWFLVLVTAALTLTISEYTQIVRHGGVQANLILMAGFNGLALLAAHYHALNWLWPGMALFTLITLAWALIRYEHGASTAVMDWAFTLAGGAYLAWTGMHFVMLRSMDAASAGQTVETGLSWTLLALGCVWSADTSAYVVGRPLGKHKMSPHLSPSKTWEGYAGGVLGAALCGGMWVELSGWVHLSIPPGLNAWHGLAIGILVATLTPLGDLGESMIKRWAGVKDSGNLIPGHGGLFDRMDTLLWTAIIVYYYVQWAI